MCESERYSNAFQYMVLSSGVQNLLFGLFWPFPVKAIKSWQVLQIVSEWPYNCQHLTCREPNSNQRQRQRHIYKQKHKDTDEEKNKHIDKDRYFRELMNDVQNFGTFGSTSFEK